MTGNEHDVIIVGAGILGSALAYALGKDGRRVMLIERDWSEPDRIVGELLQPGGVKALQLLGLEDCLEGIDAIDCHGYALLRDGSVTTVPYPDYKFPNVGKSFHHGKFIMNLRRAAKSVSMVNPIEATVNKLLSDPEDPEKIIGVSYTQKFRKSPGDEDVEVVVKQVYAPLTIVCDGCFSKFRKQVVTKEVTVKSNFVGLILKDCPLPKTNHGHVVLAKPSPILLYQIGTNDTRILVDIPGKLPSQTNGEMTSYLNEFVAPQLPKQVQATFLEAVATQRPRSMPNSWLPPSTNRKKGLILVGDAMNMRHPLTGGGMTVAFWDVVHLRELLHPNQVPLFKDSDLIKNQMSKLHWKRKSLSSVVNILAQALYSLFSAGDDPLMQELQMACFEYLGLGGRYTYTPVGLLAGLIPSPVTLVGHFFAVALYAAYRILSRGPFYMLPILLITCIRVIVLAAVVIGPVIISELLP